MGFEHKIIARIPTTDDPYYKGAFDNKKLTYYAVNPDPEINSKTVALTIPAHMIEPLIIGLFKKVQKGNGRSCINELEDVITYYKATYLTEAITEG